MFETDIGEFKQAVRYITACFPFCGYTKTIENSHAEGGRQAMQPKGANLQKIRDGKKTYAVTPHLPGGFVKPEVLRRYAEAAEQFGGVLKLTSAQRIMITGLKAEDVEGVWELLGMQPAMGFANCVRSIKMCPGDTFCKRGKQDAIKLGMELDKRYHKKEMPSRIKIGVAGCPNSCAEVHVKDVGFIGTESGWDVYVGGCAGAQPRLADKLLGSLSLEEALRIADVIVSFYKQNAEVERMGVFIDRIGFGSFQKEVLSRFYGQQPGPAEPERPLSKQQAPALMLNGNLKPGELVNAETVISDILQVYPHTVPVFRSFGLGCLGCPSSTGEPLQQAAAIHGLQVEELVEALNCSIKEEQNK